jgi:hypothetical protein
MALLFSLENLLTEEGMDSIGKDFKVQEYARRRTYRDHPHMLKSLKSVHQRKGTNLIYLRVSPCVNLFPVYDFVLLLAYKLESSQLGFAKIHFSYTVDNGFIYASPTVTCCLHVPNSLRKLYFFGSDRQRVHKTCLDFGLRGPSMDFCLFKYRLYMILFFHLRYIFMLGPNVAVMSHSRYILHRRELFNF